MDLRWALAPFCAAGLGALMVAAVSWSRGDVRASLPRAPLAWLGLLAGCFALLSLRYGAGPLMWVSPTVFRQALGVGLLMVAAGLAVVGSRIRVRADALRAEAPRSLDEGVEALRRGETPGWGVYRGRLAASDQVTSPSGVVCAFYEAELRGVTPGGGKGSLLSVERASAPVVCMRGEKAEAALSFSPSLVLAPLRVRPCLVGRPAEVAPGLDAPVEGAPPEEALSYERVGKLGEECLVVGELRPGPVAGGYELRGRQGGPAMVILGEAAEGTGTHLARRAWKLFAAAGGLTVAAAWVLAG
ncbi:hypothetical protein [Cystobacter fuscus]|uniref:hypothetical protein n=1 Tax=Cystobacter fuscus TaxID=43 RepID=UPI0005B860D4|nr:hypothetical protein [Cystobacter fuscus]